MAIIKNWQSTLAFRNFRNKTSNLSDMYWTQQLGADSLNKILAPAKPDLFSADVVVASFATKMHSQKVSETIKWLPVFMERNRLHCLVMYTAFLETYLKEITFYYIAAAGNVENASETTTPIKLNPVGQALGAPILKSSTVPDMIKYASQLYGIDFGNRTTAWIRFYKIRCAAAHNGGIATPKFLEGISDQPLSLKPSEYDHIGLTWDELRTSMRYGDEIVSMIDAKVSSHNISMIETDQVLRELKSRKKLPKPNEVWTYLHETFAIMVTKPHKREFLKKYYGII